MPLSNLQPEHYQSLLDIKVSAVKQLLAPFNAPSPEVYASPSTGYRARAEFRVWHSGDELDYVMFRPQDPRTPVAIREFPVAIASIQALMPVLMAALRANPTLRRKLFQVEFLSTLAGETLVTLIYHRKLDDLWQQAAQLLAATLGIALVGRSRKQKIILDRDYVTEKLPVHGQQFHYRQYEQAFSQPNAAVNIHMLEWACQRAQTLHGDLLELYCGNGNFTIPLAQHFGRVLATELSKVGTRAALQNLQLNAVDNVAVIRLSAEEVSQAIAGSRVFRRLAGLSPTLAEHELRSIFVDPPRAGLDPATLAMVSDFDNIMYVSCNPHTLTANLSVLCQSHTIEHFAVFDQFPYTDHTECGLLLRRH